MPRNPVVRQEEDRIPTRRAFLVVAAVVAGLLAGVLWAYLELRAYFGPAGPPPIVRPLARPVIAGVLQNEIAPELEWSRPEDERARLASFAWVDRERREVRIPIDAAMRLVAEGFEP